MSDASSANETLMAACRLKPGARVWIGGHRVAAKGVVNRGLEACTLVTTGPLDAALLVPASVDEWAYFAGKLVSRLRPDRPIWLILDDDAAFRAGMDQAFGPYIGAVDELGLYRWTGPEVVQGLVLMEFRLLRSPAGGCR